LKWLRTALPSSSYRDHTQVLGFVDWKKIGSLLLRHDRQNARNTGEVAQLRNGP
jgi:hypothetical protein